MATGIRRRHGRNCRSRDGRNCNCSEGWEASVYSKRDGKKIRRVFARQSDAKSWRADAQNALGNGTLRAPKPTTVCEAWEEWQKGAKEGTIRDRSGNPFKPATIRSYERAMRLRILPELGPVKLAEISRPDLQQLVDRLLAHGLNASTIGVTLNPLRGIYRRALSRGELAINPTTGLEMPAVRGRRERFANPEEAERLIAAVPLEDRAIWATAFYAGLRLGELMALRVADIDLASGILQVRRGWDDKEGELDLPKTDAGRRRVPIAAVLRDFLTEHLACTDRTGEQLIFGSGDSIPFSITPFRARADRGWKTAELERITPHEARHTYASLMIAAGVNGKALSTFMGHANISITLDRYGHLMPGSEEESAGLLDAYLTAERERAEEAARAAEPVATGAQAGAHDPAGPLEPHWEAN
jgi:integrase